jgi:hypothetical protein
MKKRRDDTPRPGFVRFTVLADAALVSYFKVCARKKGVYIADLMHEILTDWKRKNEKSN